ncbi:hypothetical protein AVEN_115865-1 [Araneus ventricosus]|uniref:Uncharacterized protein n=1 Tax=Araneus ventricosus TaxID=182803 RepID=A0A4Y2K7T0_ARAVE|nr:hypothetical protein AVEN_115865-1 [Araneus ventricosus]
MDFPTMNVILFAEDLFKYAMETIRMQWNMPHSLFEHQPVLETYFSPDVGRAIVHLNIISIVQSYAFANDFSYRQYLRISTKEAFDTLQAICRILMLEINGFIKVCTLTIDVFLHCLENNNYERAYDTFGIFICFLLKQRMYSGYGRQEGWRKMHFMADTINRGHARMAGN